RSPRWRWPLSGNAWLLWSAAAPSRTGLHHVGRSQVLPVPIGKGVERRHALPVHIQHLPRRLIAFLDAPRLKHLLASPCLFLGLRVGDRRQHLLGCGLLQTPQAPSPCDPPRLRYDESRYATFATKHFQTTSPMLNKIFDRSI